MGFWNGLVKLAQGKPVFETPGSQSSGASQAAPIGAAQPSSTVTAVNSEGYKVIPEVVFQHCEVHRTDNEMEVTVWVTNSSSVELELNKIVMLGMTLQLNHFFNPGEAHQLRLYKGKIPTNDYYHTANLYYKQVTSDDYFCADFMIKYTCDDKGLYIVDELHPVHPIKDV